jgi:hypothetical protein
VRQREELRQVFAVRAHGLRQGFFAPLAEVVGLRVHAHEQREPDARQRGAETRLPQRCAFRARRQVAALAGPGIAKAGGQDRDPTRVVELRAVHAQPGAQLLAGRVVPGDAGLVHAPPRRLADDHQARARAHQEHRPRPERQVRRAHAAGARLLDQGPQHAHL